MERQHSNAARNVSISNDDSMSALATVTRKRFHVNFTAKIDSSIGHFMLPLLMLTLEVLSLSIYYLISIWTTCWQNLNKIVWSVPYKILCFLTKKWLTIFDKKLTPFWKTFLWLKQLFDAKILIQRLSSFRVPKLRHSDTCNQVKSCTKHGRPDQSQRKLYRSLNKAPIPLQIWRVW